jgi:hypothetical protein
VNGYEVRLIPGRSPFDSARWRCQGTGEGCGVWYSVYVKPWENPRDAVHAAAKRHIDGGHHASA